MIRRLTRRCSGRRAEARRHWERIRPGKCLQYI